MTAIHYHVSSALKESETTPLSFKRKDWFFFFRDLPALDISNCVFNPPYFFALRTFDFITDFLCKPFFSKVKKNRVWRNDSSPYQTINRPEPVCMPYHIFSSYIEILQTSQQLFFYCFFSYSQNTFLIENIYFKKTQENITNKRWMPENKVNRSLKSIPTVDTQTYTKSPTLKHTPTHAHSNTSSQYHHSRAVWQSDSSSGGVELCAVLCALTFHLLPF